MDLAIWQSASGIWFVRRGSDGAFLFDTQWGTSLLNDVPVTDGPSGTVSAITPRTVTFTASADHESLVISYQLEIFKQGVSPEMGVPSAALSLGKPPVAGGQISADIQATIAALPMGTYVATVSAVGSGGSARSAPSAPFSR